MSYSRTQKLLKKTLPRDVKISIKAAQDIKAENIVVLALHELSSFTDYFIVMHGNSGKQNIALCNNIERELRNIKVKPLSVEGRQHAEWVLMDYGNFIIHIFTHDMRQYYALEKLWGDAPKLTYYE
jgi:ribosome-associated protein